MRKTTSLFLMVWDVVPPDNNIGVEILADIDIVFMTDRNAVPPDNNIRVENLADIDIALHDGKACGAT